MVTGIETASIILAVLPLVVKRIETYAQGVQYLKSLRTSIYLRDLDTYAFKLQTQEVLFKNTIEEALDGVVKYENDIDDLIQDIQGDQWIRLEIDKKLENKMGRSYGPFKEILSEMGQIISDIDGELGLKDQSAQELWDSTDALKREAKKLRNFFKKATFASVFDDLERSNFRLSRLVHQAGKQEAFQAKRIHGGHSIQFILEALPNEPPDSSEHPDYPRFRVILTQGTTGKAVIKDHEIETELDIDESPPPNGLHKQALPSLRKMVRFASPKPGKDGPGNHQKPPPVQIRDICSTLNKLGGANEQSLLGYLKDEERLHRIYYMRCITDHRDIFSLKDLLRIAAPRAPIPTPCSAVFNRRDRLQLAVKLACSVLRFHGNWLRAQWQSGDIMFTTTESSQQRNPYIMWDVPGSMDSQTMCKDKTSSVLVRNEVLFPLGLTLVELSLCQNLDDLYEPKDHDIVPAHTLLKTASRCLSSVQAESGADYADVVDKCLRWHGSREESLEDEAFQERVFRDIIVPLMQDLSHLEGKSAFV
ncbi:hypothetical protein P168DRAFT_304996 [Aspergillus campestris IBT 28561]|uniref:DUF7580 domain-containing protein n=1 Tax=Aspergillus campestris (strain IBT 28561) TaxID=1392248 RepID=A0A2I1D1A0_ASPC2|nr:uncharacterized protein P168DRAFT_304996 [Aspergillus campestris IBT 28561]PKY03642.1 hypothetical protein P168DRAFT_304996 [Aspergillus campestris IBT 28561]